MRQEDGVEPFENSRTKQHIDPFIQGVVKAPGREKRVSVHKEVTRRPPPWRDFPQ